MATISPLSSGRYQVKIRRKGHSVSRTFRTKQLAKEWAKGIDDQIDLGKYRGERKATDMIPDLLKRYKSEITPRKKSWKIEAGILDRLAKYFDGVSVSALGADDVVRFVDKRLIVGISPATVLKDLNKLSHALDTGVALWGCEVASNPVGVAKRILSTTKSLRVSTGRDRRLQAGERELLIASRIGHIIEFALETGMRRGEIVRARASHINGFTLHIAETKTDTPRTIALSAKAREIFEANPDGFGYADRTVSKIFLSVCRENRIEGLRLHDLRHEATSLFFEKGLSIEEVASITGHSDWRMLKRYTHLKPSDIAKKL